MACVLTVIISENVFILYFLAFVLSFSVYCKSYLNVFLWHLNCRKKKTAEFLRDAVETRLRMYIPYIETWPQVSRRRDLRAAGWQGWCRNAVSFLALCLQAMSILLLPHNIPDSLKHLSTLVDDIWYYAGDRSTDVSGPYHPRPPPSSVHTFLSPYHHHPHNIRPATSKVTPPTNARFWVAGRYSLSWFKLLHSS